MFLLFSWIKSKMLSKALTFSIWACQKSHSHNVQTFIRKHTMHLIFKMSISGDKIQVLLFEHCVLIFKFDGLL